MRKGGEVLVVAVKVDDDIDETGVDAIDQHFVVFFSGIEFFKQHGDGVDLAKTHDLLHFGSRHLITEIPKGGDKGVGYIPGVLYGGAGNVKNDQLDRAHI